MRLSLAQSAQATLRAHVRAACPSCCSACAAPTSLLIPARPYQIQISRDHCLLERNGQAHLCWKCWYKIAGVESLIFPVPLSFSLYPSSMPLVRTSKHSNKAKVLPKVLCNVMLPKHLCWTCRPLPSNASSGHLRTSNKDCQKQRHPKAFSVPE